VVAWANPLEALTAARRAGEPAEPTSVAKHSRNGVGRTRAVMPHGGSGERFVYEPVPRGPEALFTFGRGPVVASRRRLAAELTSSLPKLARRSVQLDASAVCLHDQDACTKHTVTHSAGQRHPLPGGAETGAITSLRPRRSPMASHWRETKPSGSGDSTEVEHPSPVAALAEARPFPANGARPRETMRAVREACFAGRGGTSNSPPRGANHQSLLAERDIGRRHVAKTTDTRCRFRVGAHLRRHVRPSNRSRDGQSRHDPTPMKLRRLLVATTPVIPENPPPEQTRNGF